MKETSLSNKAQANQKIIAEFVVQAYAPRPAAPEPGIVDDEKAWEVHR